MFNEVKLDPCKISDGARNKILNNSIVLIDIIVTFKTEVTLQYHRDKTDLRLIISYIIQFHQSTRDCSKCKSSRSQ
jgi:hypothetical protein